MSGPFWKAGVHAKWKKNSFGVVVVADIIKLAVAIWMVYLYSYLISF